MIPKADQWDEIAGLAQGDLEKIPYSVLLAALARGRRTAVLEMVRKPVSKQIVVVEGVPVECRSNLKHETFGRFLLSAGNLSPEDHQSALSDSLSRGVPLGEILLERGILTPQEVYKHLQQNLARKLLDGFTWSHGAFRLRDQVSAVDSTIEVNVAQLILTGVLKLSPLAEVNSGIASYFSEPLALNPEPPMGEAALKFGAGAQKVIQSLQERPCSLDELAGKTLLCGDEMGRIVYALALLEVVVPAGEIASKAAPTRSPDVEPAAERPQKAPPAAASGDQELLLLQSKVLEAYLSFRRKDAFDFLGLPEEAGMSQIEGAFLEAAKTYAPWPLEERGLSDFAEQARLLFLSAAEAYAELKDTERRGALIHRRKVLREEHANGKMAKFKIKTELLDPKVQFRKGRKLLATGELKKALEFLEFAADCDPQNPVYRSEAAYCRYLFSPAQFREQTLADLEEALRIDLQCGLALYYLGLIHREDGDLEEAEKQLRKSVKLMAPDRRPIEALRELAKKKRRR
ncbi:MAG: DUF4388 domain-containing protein [Thermoanaerobaculia bacterium]